MRGIYGYGFERPSQIQSRAIKPLCSGLDVIAQAQSGTGKVRRERTRARTHTPCAISSFAHTACYAILFVSLRAQTATFTIGILQQLDLQLLECQALVLAPTRELAQQIHKVVVNIGDYLGVQCHACIGGTRVRDDMAKLQAGECMPSVVA